MRFSWLVWAMLLLLFLWNVTGPWRTEARIAVIAVGALLLVLMLLALLGVL